VPVSLAFLALGFILLTLGVGVLTMAAVFWARGVRALVTLGAFSVLYGAGYLLRSDVFNQLLGLSAGTASALFWLTTYWLPIPALMYTEARRGPGWHRSLHRMWQAWIPLALVLTTIDAVYRRPGALTAWYVPFELVMEVTILAHLLWPRSGADGRERLGIQRIGGIAFLVTVMYDEVAARVWPVPPIVLEPIGAAMFVGSLAMVTVDQFFARERELAVVEHEMRTAKRIQESILPGSGVTLPNLEIAARYLPMRGIAGDLYDFHMVDDHRVGVLVADVTGHGVPAALIASMVKVAFAAQRDCAERPGALLARMNQTLSGHLSAQFVTAAYLLFDTARGELRYSLAGHPPPIVARQTTGELVDLTEAGGLLLGFDAGATYRDGHVALHAGDRVLLYTDGVIEAEGATGLLFGDARLRDVLASGRRLHADAFAGLLLDELRSWSAHHGTGGSLGDDVTFVVVDVPSVPAVHP
jgi:sigma-B regulation protein RsbU (phosphoserine phosphatase)